MRFWSAAVWRSGLSGEPGCGVDMKFHGLAVVVRDEYSEEGEGAAMVVPEVEGDAAAS